jgi:hypothetical protein
VLGGWLLSNKNLCLIALMGALPFVPPHSIPMDHLAPLAAQQRDQLLRIVLLR